MYILKGMGIPKVGPAGPAANAPGGTQTKFGGPPKVKYGVTGECGENNGIPVIGLDCLIDSS